MAMPLLRFPGSVAALLAAPHGMPDSFAEPVGEASLFSADSLTWRIFANPVTLFIGGVAAVLLELAEPGVRAGVWEHSSFRQAPLERLHRTGFAALVTVYAPASVAQRMIERVVRQHDRVHGLTEAGRPYRANDPVLLDWVQATASFGFIEAHSRYVAPLSAAAKSQAWSESARAARLYGAVSAPTSIRQWEGLLSDTRPRLQAHPVLFEFLDLMTQVPLMPRALRPLQRLLLRAAVDLLPPPVQSALGLQHRGLPWAARGMVRLLSAAAGRFRPSQAPAVQAALRLGLPADHAYRRP